MLDSATIAALTQGRKIQAIKLIREQQGIGLKEAKAAVDAYLAEHPELKTAEPPSTARVLLLACAIALIFGVYKLLGA